MHDWTLEDHEILVKVQLGTSLTQNTGHPCGQKYQHYKHSRIVSKSYDTMHGLCNSVTDTDVMHSCECNILESVWNHRSITLKNIIDFGHPLSDYLSRYFNHSTPNWETSFFVTRVVIWIVITVTVIITAIRIIAITTLNNDRNRTVLIIIVLKIILVEPGQGNHFVLTCLPP